MPSPLGESRYRRRSTRGNGAAESWHGENMPQNAPDPIGQAIDQVRDAARVYRDATSTGSRSAARKELHEAVVAAVQLGAKQIQVARASGLSSAQVSRVSRGRTSGRSPLPPATYLSHTLPAEEIARRYTSGASAAQIAASYGCSKTTILRFLQNHGVARRSGAWTKLPVTNQDLAQRYVKEGTLLKDLAAEFGVVSATISERLADAGVVVPVGRRRIDLPVAEILRRYEGGEPVNVLARAYGVSSPVIYHRLHEHGRALRSPRTTPEQRRRAVALYQTGLTDAAVAAKLNMSRTTVRKAIQEAGVKRPTPEERARAHLQSEDMQEIVRRRRAGEPVRALAVEYGIPRNTLVRRLARAENRAESSA